MEARSLGSSTSHAVRPCGSTMACTSDAPSVSLGHPSELSDGAGDGSRTNITALAASAANGTAAAASADASRIRVRNVESLGDGLAPVRYGMAQGTMAFGVRLGHRHGGVHSRVHATDALLVAADSGS